MTRFVQFPGTSGSFVSTDDINLLDADTAHLQQSLGLWSSTPIGFGGGIQLSTSITPEFGDFIAEGIVTDTNLTAARVDADEATPATPGQTITCSVFAGANLADRVATVDIRWFDSGGQLISSSGLIGETPLSVDSLVQVSNTDVAPALTASVGFRIRFSESSVGRADGDIYYWDAANIVVGTDPTFVPSLRIVGDLDLRAKAAATDWTPDAQQAFISKWEAGVPRAGYAMLLRTPSGELRLFNVVGDVSDFANSTVPTGIADGVTAEVRATKDVSTGVVTFYVDGVQLGNTVAAAAGVPDYLDQSLEVGSLNAGDTTFSGDIYTAEVHDGIDGPIVARFDAEDIVL